MDRLFDFAARAVTLNPKSDSIEHVLITKRLLQKFDCAGLHGRRGHSDVAVPRHENDWNSVIRFRQLGLQLQTAQSWHERRRRSGGNVGPLILEEVRGRGKSQRIQPDRPE
jgi:hypothetical protein